MIRTQQGGRAHQIEGLTADAYEGFSDRKLYVLEGQAGIFRRLTKLAKKDRRPDAVTALFQDAVIDLVRATALEAELVEAGMVCAPLPELGVLVRDAAYQAVRSSLRTADPSGTADESPEDEIASPDASQAFSFAASERHAYEQDMHSCNGKQHAESIF